VIRSGIDHIALTVPDLDHQVDRLTTTFGMSIESRTPDFAVLADTATVLRLELGGSGDGEVQAGRLGFQADDVDSAHEQLIAADSGGGPEPASSRRHPDVHVVSAAAGRRRGATRALRRPHLR
jgi:catechol 2,3-dioxygenase-like lactoylglutathione lyase family enzyme